MKIGKKGLEYLGGEEGIGHLKSAKPSRNREKARRKITRKKVIFPFGGTVKKKQLSFRRGHIKNGN